MSYYIPPQDKHFDGPDCYNWMEVFAWLPVRTIGGKYVWLRKIYKQKYWTSLGPPIGQNFHMEPIVEYAELFDILKNDAQNITA